MSLFSPEFENRVAVSSSYILFSRLSARWDSVCNEETITTVFRTLILTRMLATHVVAQVVWGGEGPRTLLAMHSHALIDHLHLLALYEHDAFVRLLLQSKLARRHRRRSDRLPLRGGRRWRLNSEQRDSIVIHTLPPLWTQLAIVWGNSQRGGFGALHYVLAVKVVPPHQPIASASDGCNGVRFNSETRLWLGNVH